MSVTARAERDGVRVEDGDDPEIDATRRELLEPASYRNPGGLVPVHGADDELAVRASGIAYAKRQDRTAVRRSAENDAMRGS